MLKGIASLYIALFAFALQAQQIVDVFPESTFLYESFHIEDTSRTIYRQDSDGKLRKISVPLSEKISLYGQPRPKIRNENIWVSNGERIAFLPLDAPNDAAWTSIRLPKGIISFQEFEIISDDEAMLIGAYWDIADENGKVPIRQDTRFVFNYETGAVKRTLESFDLRLLDSADENTAALTAMKLFSVYLCRFDPYVLVVGKFTGTVTVFDTDKGSVGEYQIVPIEDVPKDSYTAVNNGRAIAWVGPLAGDEALVCCRKLVPQPSGVLYEDHYFRTLNLKTGKVRLEGSSYRGFEALSHATLFERGGELLSARDVIGGGTVTATQQGGDTALPLLEGSAPPSHE
jgi:hypothetical protein